MCRFFSFIYHIVFLCVFFIRRHFCLVSKRYVPIGWLRKRRQRDMCRVCVGGAAARGCVVAFAYIYIWFWRDSVRSRSHPISDPGRRRRGIINETDFVPISRGIPGTFHLRQIRPNSTRPVTVPRNTTHTVCWRTITCECTIRLHYYYIISIFFPSSFDHIISYYLYCYIVRCVIRITVMVFTRHRPRSRGPKITGIYICNNTRNIT